MMVAVAISSIERSFGRGRRCFEAIIDFFDFGEGFSMYHSGLEGRLKEEGGN